MEPSSPPERRPLRERIAQRIRRRSPQPKNASDSAASGAPASADAPSTADTTFECNVCFDVPRDPVVTPCGHLYCWPCLYRWIRLHADSPQCPVCKAGVDKRSVIPIYGRGRSEADDPRTRALPDDDAASDAEADVPPRPSGHRAQPLRRRVHATTTFGVHHTFGINANPENYDNFSFSTFGLFPSLFGLQIAYPHINEPPRDEPRDNGEESTSELGKFTITMFDSLYAHSLLISTFHRSAQSVHTEIDLFPVFSH